MSSRDPSPSPKLENGFTLSGFRPQRRTTFDKPTHIAQTEEPWSSLHETATLSSSRRSVMHCEPQAPKDSLDLQLKSVYDHHKDFLWFRNQVLYQQETVSVDHRKQNMLEKEQDKDIRPHFLTSATPERRVAAYFQCKAPRTTATNMRAL